MFWIFFSVLLLLHFPPYSTAINELLFFDSCFLKKTKHTYKLVEAGMLNLLITAATFFKSD